MPEDHRTWARLERTTAPPARAAPRPGRLGAALRLVLPRAWRLAARARKHQ